MSDKTAGVMWSDEMKNDLAKYWLQGKDILEISTIMAIPFEKIKGAISRARSGQWGEEAKQIFGTVHPKGDKLQEDNAEAKERGLSYGQLQAERLKSKTRIAWSLEMKNELRRLHEQGMSTAEIAERMGVDETKVAAQLKHMKYRPAASFNVKQCDDTAAAPEPEQCEVPEPTAQKFPEAVSVDEAPEEPKAKATTAEPINMIDAVDILIALAEQLGADEITEMRSSKLLDKAAIKFECGVHTYVLELFGVYE